LFLLDHVGRLVTVEHDRNWMEAVRAAAGVRPGDIWQARLMEPERRSHSALTDPSRPDDYTSSDVEWSGFSFQRYAAVIDDYPPDSFDLVVVDGRARPSCAWHSIPSIKPAGFMLLDNAERPHYQSVHHRMRELGWTRHELSGPTAYLRHFTCSVAWQRPPLAG